MNKEYSENGAPLCECGEEHHHSFGGLKMPETDILFGLSDFFKIFGDPTRLSILFALDNGEMCGCDLVELLGLTKAVISYQLKVLERHDLVRSRKVGRRVIYSLSDEHVKDIIEKALDHINE